MQQQNITIKKKKTHTKINSKKGDIKQSNGTTRVCAYVDM